MVNIITLNVRGLRKKKKRLAMFKWLKKYKCDIAFLQETYCLESDINQWKTEWGGDLFAVCNTSHSKGLVTLTSKKLNAKLCELAKDDNGRYLCVKAVINNATFKLWNIYGPNNDDPIFFENTVFHEFQNCQNESDFAILGGDWNISLSQELDTFGYISENNKNAKKCLIDCMENLALVDIFRFLYPNKKRYSWRQYGGTKRARLDYFLISSSLVPFVAHTDIVPGIESDHSIPTLDIDFARFQRGRGFF